MKSLSGRTKPSSEPHAARGTRVKRITGFESV